MKTNSKIPFIDVTILTKRICEYITGDEYEITPVKLNLFEDNKEKSYISVIAHKKDDLISLIDDVLKNEGKQKDNYELDKKYCHITTYEEGLKKDFISFDNNDDCPIKANFDSDYNYLEYFFKSFISFRNNLINTNQVIKDDDIEQYFQSIIGFPNEKKLTKNKLK